MSTRRTPPGHSQAGLSLVELMVSMALGLIILSAVLTLFFNTSAARSEVERTSRQIENGRYAIELLTTDLQLAGFYGEFDTAAVPVPAALPADPCSLVPADWEAWLALHLQGYDSAGFTSVDCTLTNLKPGTDVLMVRRARTCLAGVDGCDGTVVGQPYIQTSLCESEATSYKIGREGATAFDLKKKDCATTADKREYYARIYFVGADNGAGDAVPTLKRLELTAAGWTTVPLVEGIEQFQVEYGLDGDGDGAPEVYVANPGDHPAGACTGACPVNNWMNVVTVRFHVLARNLENSPGYVDTKTYALGADASGNPLTLSPGGAYRRHVYSSLVRVANAAGKRDTP